MEYPKTTFVYRKEYEAERIAFTAHSLRNYFYIKKGFYVLPYLVPGNAKVIYFPQLDFKSIPHFWDQVKSISEKDVYKHPDLVAAVSNLLPDEIFDFSSIEAEWQKVASSFWDTILSLFPDWFIDIKKIEVRPSRYCSIGSSYRYDKKNSTIIVYVRSDSSVAQIAKTILIDRLYVVPEMAIYTWEQKMGNLDFLFKHTKLAMLFPRYTSVLYSAGSLQSAALAKESNYYLETLGFKHEKLFQITSDGVMLRNSPLMLTMQERTIMQLLINKRRRVVSFDDIAQSIWKEKTEEKYSLYAISKVIGRLREKIEKQGVFSDIIQTKRGEGYMLLD